MNGDLHNPSIELSVLGRVALRGAEGIRDLTAAGFTPDLFASRLHRDAYSVLLSLASTGRLVDDDRLRAEAFLAGCDDLATYDQAFQLHLAIVDTFFADGGDEEYVALLRDLARRRTLREAGKELVAAAEEGDDRRRDAALAKLSVPLGRAAGKSANQLATDFIARHEEPEPERFPLPWPPITRRLRGGLARQHVLTIGGWSGDGKTVAFDQIMAHFAAAGLGTMTYINEMSEDERMDRAIATLSGVDYGDIDDRSYKRDPGRARRVLLAAAHYGDNGPGITECPGWTAEEIANDVRAHGWDVFGVDILHEIPHSERNAERGVSKIVQTLRMVAREVNGVCVMTSHLNDSRITGAHRPIPCARDLRDSGMIFRGSDVVMFVYRENDDDGRMDVDNRALIKFDKLRKGELGSFAARFDPKSMRYLLVDHRLEAAA